ncbi:MAG: hypothetical protein CL942_08520 [Desulfovibrio sp.]|nr:hypothetical protein [Desulfovibrio sp.]|tara:strand:+ start:74 stop:394 length:321 start_codon:yes stop_codon:yes gene_type:complete
MKTYRIPLTPVPQAFSIMLAGTLYQLTVRWNDVLEGGWVLDINLPENAGQVVNSIPLVTGVDLLEPYGYLGIGGGLMVWSDDHDDPPSIDNLGSGVDILFVVQEEA